MSQKVYMIIGVTKHGKTTFINKVFGTNFPAGFSSGNSVTTEVHSIEVAKNEFFGNCLIFDTPGLPDSKRNDEDVANEIVQGLLKYKKYGQLEMNGIIFIQRIGEFFNINQYKVLLDNLSSNFNTDNILLLITKVNTYGDIEEQTELVNGSIQMCYENKIKNFVFWDSKKPFFHNGKTQEENLMNALINVKSSRMDKLEYFDDLIVKKAKELQQLKKIIKLKNVIKKIPGTRMVVLYNTTYETFYDEELLEYVSNGTIQEKPKFYDFKKIDPYYYRWYHHGNGTSYGAEIINSGGINGNLIEFCDFERKWNGGLETEMTYFRRFKTINFVFTQPRVKIKWWCRITYEKRVPYQGVENCMVDYETYEPYEEIPPLENFMTEAKELVLQSFIKKK